MLLDGLTQVASSPMDGVPYTVVDGVACIHMSVSHGAERDVRDVTEAIRSAKDAGIGKMLIDIVDVDSRPPTVVEHHWIMHEWAGIARGTMRIALVMRPEFIGPDDFGSVVARSRGLLLREFSSRGEAIKWLRDR